MGKLPAALLLSMALLFVELEVFCSAKNISVGCIADERNALLKFKTSVVDPYNYLSSWNDSNCCNWKGVHCDMTTSHVIRLNLVNIKLSGSIPTSIGELSALEELDISFNELSGSIPRSIGNLSNLKELDIYSNELSGSIPTWIGNLSALEVLSIGSNQFSGSIPASIGHLSALLELNVFNNRLSGPIPASIGKMSALRVLDASRNQLFGSIPASIGVLPALSWLVVSENQFSGVIPAAIGNLSTLARLDAHSNNFSGSIPSSIGKLSALTEINFGNNTLSNPIPSSMGNLTKMVQMSLDSNYLSGEIPLSFGQLSNLEGIQISNNLFNASLSEALLSNLSKLRELRASSNLIIKFNVGYNWAPPFQLWTLLLGSTNIGGWFPPWLQTQKALTWLDLSNCSISGTLPKWLGGMMNLTDLYLSRNYISGTITDLPSSISTLDLSDNMITHLPSNIGHDLPLLQSLFLARNGMNGSLPGSLCKVEALFRLHLSVNNLSGNLLDCYFPNLMYLGLSSNELSGIIPESIGHPSYLVWLRLDNNHLSGHLPSTLKNCSYMEVLDVGGNNLSGEIPNWIGTHMHYLHILRLRNNQFNGIIPWELCQASQLQIIDLGNNKLNGSIPHCVGNFSGMILPFEFNIGFDGRGSEDPTEQVMKGMEMQYSKTLKYLANLDLSGNNLVGEIPSELTRLVGLKGLNLSHNHLEGEIPKMIGGLTLLESLDLSNNSLFGRIPISLSNLTFLSFLNFSNNNLSGEIPTGHQLQTLNDPSIYAGNPQLCGDPLPKKCHNSNEAPKHANAEKNVAANEDTSDKLCFYGFVMGGFASGLWGFIGVLVFKRGWRRAYFRLIEALISKMLRN